MMPARGIVATLVLGLAGDVHSAAPSRKVDFAAEVRPILTASCMACHGPDKQRGGLRLDRKADAFRGGVSGPAIVPGRAGESELLARLTSEDPARAMPPKGNRLTAEQLEILGTWVAQGAEWPDSDRGGDGREWWSLRPLTRPAVPGPSTGAANPIDAFIRAALAREGLTPSPDADRRTLIRRVTFDLAGLPPTPDEVDAFIADAAPDAYERLVDRLLASPRYGERWARHWLDVVHYGDTHGYDKDQPRPNAYPYRDYVIRAFNDDRPYARFVREQIAGDTLDPGEADGVIAMGFIAAGPWDFIGHAEVTEMKRDGKVARHLDRDDMVATTMNTFASLTVQCAQCHDHKFDPIRQEDYYRLQAVFASLDRADRPYYDDPGKGRRALELLARQGILSERRRALDAAIRDAGGAALATLDRRIGDSLRPPTRRPEFGYHSAIEAAADRAKWVQVDLGRPVAIDRVVLWPCHDDFNGIGAGFGFPSRYRVEMSDDPGFASGVGLIADRTAVEVPNPGVAPASFGAGKAEARYVRVTATSLARRLDDYIFSLSELEVIDAGGANVAAGAPVASLDTIEAPPRWRRSNLVDGFASGKRAPAEDAGRLEIERKALVERAVGAKLASETESVAADLARVEDGLRGLPPSGRVYAGTIHDGGAAAFRGTGPDGGRPRVIRLLRRGDVADPAQEVGPGAPAVAEELPGDFRLPPGHAEGDRRAALALWLTDPRNPLTWRSIVNRVWQYHFGRGIVATTSDFGRMGGLPSHPDLLDWLAVEFRDGGQSLKSLHRLIVTSATYRQASSGDPARESLDASNVHLWRMNRRKLGAEEIRDAALLVAGTLDLAMYGPAFRDFEVERPEHSPHYEYDAHDPDDPKCRRRSIYRFLVRSKPQPFLAALDCADPSVQVDRRNETLSPLQALALYNDGFMLAQAKHLAARVAVAPDPVTEAFRLAFGRIPTGREHGALGDYARNYGLANACRVILNLNEFVFVD